MNQTTQHGVIGRAPGLCLPLHLCTVKEKPVGKMVGTPSCDPNPPTPVDATNGEMCTQVHRGQTPAYRHLQVVRRQKPDVGTDRGRDRLHRM